MAVAVSYFAARVAILNVAQMGRFTLLELTQLYMEIIGRAYWELDVGETGPPSQIFPLIAHEVEDDVAADADQVNDESPKMPTSNAPDTNSRSNGRTPTIRPPSTSARNAPQCE